MALKENLHFFYLFCLVGVAYGYYILCLSHEYLNHNHVYTETFKKVETVDALSSDVFSISERNVYLPNCIIGATQSSYSNDLFSVVSNGPILGRVYKNNNFAGYFIDPNNVSCGYVYLTPATFYKMIAENVSLLTPLQNIIPNVNFDHRDVFGLLTSSSNPSNKFSSLNNNKISFSAAGDTVSIELYTFNQQSISSSTPSTSVVDVITLDIIGFLRVIPLDACSSPPYNTGSSTKIAFIDPSEIYPSYSIVDNFNKMHPSLPALSIDKFSNGFYEFYSSSSLEFVQSPSASTICESSLDANGSFYPSASPGVIIFQSGYASTAYSSVSTSMIDLSTDLDTLNRDAEYIVKQKAEENYSVFITRHLVGLLMILCIYFFVCLCAFGAEGKKFYVVFSTKSFYYEVMVPANGNNMILRGLVTGIRQSSSLPSSTPNATTTTTAHASTNETNTSSSSSSSQTQLVKRVRKMRVVFVVTGLIIAIIFTCLFQIYSIINCESRFVHLHNKTIFYVFLILYCIFLFPFFCLMVLRSIKNSKIVVHDILQQLSKLSLQWRDSVEINSLSSRRRSSHREAFNSTSNNRPSSSNALRNSITSRPGWTGGKMVAVEASFSSLDESDYAQSDDGQVELAHKCTEDGLEQGHGTTTAPSATNPNSIHASPIIHSRSPNPIILSPIMLTPQVSFAPSAPPISSFARVSSSLSPSPMRLSSEAPPHTSPMMDLLSKAELEEYVERMVIKNENVREDIQKSTGRSSNLHVLQRNIDSPIRKFVYEERYSYRNKQEKVNDDCIIKSEIDKQMADHNSSFSPSRDEGPTLSLPNPIITSENLQSHSNNFHQIRASLVPIQPIQILMDDDGFDDLKPLSRLSSASLFSSSSSLSFDNIPDDVAE